MVDSTTSGGLLSKTVLTTKAIQQGVSPALRTNATRWPDGIVPARDAAKPVPVSYHLSVPTVSRLSIAPVKSLALLHPDEVVLEACGVAANRRFYLIEKDGRLLNGLRCGKLVAVVPEYDAVRNRLALRFPGGETVEGEVAVSDSVTTDWTGRLVAGRIVEGPWAAALSAYVGRSVRLVRSKHPGAACSHHGVSILSDASVKELARRAAGDGSVDPRRFRMLIAIAGCAPHEEDEWIGRAVAIGEALVRVVVPTARCATTTHSPITGVRDFDTLRAIKAYRGVRERKAIDFGVYGDVERPGRVGVGDPVSPV